MSTLSQPAAAVSTSSQPAATGLAATGLAATGPAATGLAATGLAATGLAATGPAATGLAATGLAATGPAEAKIDDLATLWAAMGGHLVGQEAWSHSDYTRVADLIAALKSVLATKGNLRLTTWGCPTVGQGVNLDIVRGTWCEDGTVDMLDNGDSAEPMLQFGGE